MGYTKKALKGRTFESLEAQNEFLDTWNRTVARLRIHGTTKQQVWKRFLETDKLALQPLPGDPFALFSIGTRKVHPDGHIEVERTYYSVPHTHVGQRVEVRWDQRMVRVFAQDRLIAVHKKSAAAGSFRTQRSHLPSHKSLTQEEYEAKLLGRAERLGPAALAFARGAIRQRGPLAFRVVQGVLSLCRKHPKEHVAWACARATSHGSFRYHVVKELLEKTKPPGQELNLTQEHEIIRPLSAYATLLEQRGKP